MQRFECPSTGIRDRDGVMQDCCEPAAEKAAEHVRCNAVSEREGLVILL